MVGEIGAGLVALKSAFDLAKGIAEVADVSRRNTLAIELQQLILSAQQSAMAANEQISALVKQKAELEAKIATMEKWEREQERYQLVALYDGSLAFVLKEEMAGVEPPHHICAHCFQDGKKSILQGMSHSYGAHILTCPRCKLKIIRSYDPSTKMVF